MESISQAVERPPQSQIEGVTSDESRQFIAKPSGGPGGSQSGHQRKRDFRKRYWRSVQRGQNPSLVGQSGSKGRAQRCLESCTNFCQRLISFLASMVTWAQLKTLALMIQLLTFAKTMLCQAQAKLMTLIKFCGSIFDIGTDILQGKRHYIYCLPSKIVL